MPISSADIKPLDVLEYTGTLTEYNNVTLYEGERLLYLGMMDGRFACTPVKWLVRPESVPDYYRSRRHHEYGYPWIYMSAYHVKKHKSSCMFGNNDVRI